MSGKQQQRDNRQWDTYMHSLRNKTNATAEEKRMVENWNKQADAKEKADKEKLNTYMSHYESNIIR
jgi:hypothetical protein